MSGWVVAHAPCYCCRRPFGFNPHRVPSFVSPAGRREPVCPDCMDQINARRAQMGLPPHRVLPGAYDPLPEAEL